jgi:iron complex outermembrane receptor protein
VGVTSTTPGLPVSSLYIEPEKATDTEVGVKTSWFKRRLTVNGNLFWTDVDDYQATLLVQDSGGIFQQLLSNIGKVRTRGVELEVTAIPVRDVTLRLASSYNDAVYRSYTNAPCSAEQLEITPTNCVQDLSGQQIVGAPKWIVNPGIDYGHRLPGDLKGTASANYAWRSSYFGSADNSELARIGAYGVLNLRYGVTGVVGANTWNASIWANNALDKHYVVGGLTAAPTLRNYSLYPGSPRIYGATVRFEF